jgi:hypothetical protein
MACGLREPISRPGSATSPARAGSSAGLPRASAGCWSPRTASIRRARSRRQPRERSRDGGSTHRFLTKGGGKAVFPGQKAWRRRLTGSIPVRPAVLRRWASEWRRDQPDDGDMNGDRREPGERWRKGPLGHCEPREDGWRLPARWPAWGQATPGDDRSWRTKIWLTAAARSRRWRASDWARAGSRPPPLHAV